MKFVTNDIIVKKNLLILLIVSIVTLSGISGTYSKTNNPSMPSILERIYAGDMTEKEILDIYTKNYKPELEYHQIFHSCVNHLYTQKKQTNSSMLNKILFGFEKILSNPSKLQIQELGIKVDCEIYLNKILSNDYRAKKLSERNPMNEKIHQVKLLVGSLKEQYDTLTDHSLIQRSENKSKKSQMKLTKSKNNSSEKEDEDKITKTTIIGGESSNLLGSANSSSTTTTTSTHTSTSRTITINGRTISDTDTDVHFYDLSDGDNDISSITKYVSEMTTKLRNEREKYANIYSQYEVTIKDYSSLKEEYNKILKKECDCDASLKTCKFELSEKKAEITKLISIKYDLETQLTICKTNPPKADCKDVKKELNIKINELKKCETDKIEINNKYEFYFKSYTEIKNKYDKIVIELNECKTKPDCKNVVEKIEKKYITKITIIEQKNEQCTAELTVIKKKLEICQKERDINVICCNSCKNIRENKDYILIKQQLDYCLSREKDLQLTIKHKDIKIEELTELLSIRDKTIIEINQTIINLRYEINEEKKKCEKKISELNITIEEWTLKFKTCESEKKTIIIYKTKYDKIRKECDDEKQILIKKITKLSLEITVLKEKLSACKKSESDLKIEITNKITIINKCEKDKKKCQDDKKTCTDTLIEKTTEIETIIEKHKKEIIVIGGECDRNCKNEKKLLLIKIESLEKELEICNQKCKKIEDITILKQTINQLNIEIKQYKVQIENYIIEIGKCKKDLEEEKNIVIKIENEIKIIKVKLETCEKDLGKCEKGERCDNSEKYQELIKKYYILIETSENYLTYWNKCKKDLADIKIKLDICQKRKCDETCPGKLKTCLEEKTEITNTYEQKISIKITLIKNLNIKIEEIEKTCKEDSLNIRLELKTCKADLIKYKFNHSTCLIDLKNEITIRKQYYTEVIYYKKELKNCTKNAVCKEDEIKMHQRIADKCQEHRNEIETHLNSLREKFGKLHKEKISIYSESNTMVENISKQCNIDITNLNNFMEKLNLNINEIFNFKNSYVAEMKKDQVERNKFEGYIQIKNDEITRLQKSLKDRNSDIERLNQKLKELLEKIGKNTNFDEITTISNEMIAVQKELNMKNAALLEIRQKIVTAEGELTILKNQVQTADKEKTIENKKYEKIKTIYVNIEDSKTVIEKFIKVRKDTTKDVDKKVIKFTKRTIADDPVVSILKGEKDIIANNSKKTENDNISLEKQILELKKKLKELSTANVQSQAGDVDIFAAMKKGGVMRILENREFVMNNCSQIESFKAKIDEICKSSNSVSTITNNTSTTTTIKKNTSTSSNLITKRKSSSNTEKPLDEKKSDSGEKKLTYTDIIDKALKETEKEQKKTLEKLKNEGVEGKEKLNVESREKLTK